MGRDYDDAEVTGRDGEFLAVLKHQGQRQDQLVERQVETDAVVGDAIKRTEALLQTLGRPLPSTGQPRLRRRPSLPTRPWSEILAEAQREVSSPVGLSDLLSAADVARVEARIESLRGEFDTIHRLDAVDWMIAGVAGTLAALADTFLVKLPSSPGFLGQTPTQGGPLSDFIRGRIRSAFSPEQIRELERAFPVPYDASTSRGLLRPISGLGPRTHRFQSLGHDPVLGFVFGTADILRGTMTAVDSSGELIHQATQSPPLGMSLFEALATQFGHLGSDVGTRAGLPAPLTPMLQFLQVGSVDAKGRTVGEVSRLLYAKGYDFGHFLSMSVSPLVIEVVVRISYAIKRLMEGHDLSESIPLRLPGRPHPPKLQTMLFTAHLIATAANAGRVYLSPGFNPLMINYPQWLAFSKYALGQLKWALGEKEKLRLAHVQAKTDADWEALSHDLHAWWNETPPSGDVPVLGGE